MTMREEIEKPRRIEFRIHPPEVLTTHRIIGDYVDSLELENALHAIDAWWLEYMKIRVTDDADIRTALIDNPHLELLEFTKGEGNSCYILAFVEEVSPFFLQVLTQNRTVPHQVLISDGAIHIAASVPNWPYLKSLSEDIEADYEGFSLESVTASETLGFPLGSERIRTVFSGKLTESQLNILSTAYEMGFFEIPQRAKGGEVASALGISQSTFSEQLRRAQSRLLQIIFSK